MSACFFAREISNGIHRMYSKHPTILDVARRNLRVAGMTTVEPVPVMIVVPRCVANRFSIAFLGDTKFGTIQRRAHDDLTSQPAIRARVDHEIKHR